MWSCHAISFLYSTKKRFLRPRAGVGNLFGWESQFLAGRAILLTFFSFFSIFFNKCSHQKSHIWLASHRFPTPDLESASLYEPWQASIVIAEIFKLNFIKLCWTTNEKTEPFSSLFTTELPLSHLHETWW